MSPADWLVLLGTLTFIVVYGIYKTRDSGNLNAYLKGGSSNTWWKVGLSVMATQASAITFLSTPGQAYTDGMKFLQFYLGLPLAMIVVCVLFIPAFIRSGVYTAYEMLETRFDLKTRLFTAFLFLMQRGLAAGITIYAPAIILSSVLHWPLYETIWIIGLIVILYTVSGGSRAVSQTQQHQMAIIFGGMFFTFYWIVAHMPESMTWNKTMQVAQMYGRLEIITLSFDWNDRYNLWSGLLGGFFLALAYFGTDHSQVARYISGKSISEIRLGLIMNGLLKIPMQFFILLTGVCLFVFLRFEPAPLFFNPEVNMQMHSSVAGEEWKSLENQWVELNQAQNEWLQEQLQKQDISKSSGNQWLVEEQRLRKEAVSMIKQTLPKAETKDTDYIFLHYILHYLPAGFIGLLLAVILSAAMSSTSSELNALASTTCVDVYRRLIKPQGSDQHYVNASKIFTAGWGLLAILFATLASLVDNLIQAVNILGSLFYGTILGIFLTALLIKKVKGSSVFWAGLMAETVVLITYAFSDLGFLWFNVMGCFLVITLSVVFSHVKKSAIE